MMRSELGTMAARIAGAGAGVAIACAAGALAAGLGYRFGLWHYRTGFTVLRWAVYIALGAGVIAAVGAVIAMAARRRIAAAAGLVGLLVALAVAATPWNLQRAVAHVPHIHDITTDTENPPQFVALRALREHSPNGADYGGARIASQQKSAYPDIQPVLLDMPPAAAFARALEAARRMGWEIVSAEPAAGRIEATATTFWFRFKDDVIVRVRPNGPGSRLDIRSVSRVGRSDLGTNAKRIRAYFQKLLDRG